MLKLTHFEALVILSHTTAEQQSALERMASYNGLTQRAMLEQILRTHSGSAIEEAEAHHKIIYPEYREKWGAE